MLLNVKVLLVITPLYITQRNDYDDCGIILFNAVPKSQKQPEAIVSLNKYISAMHEKEIWLVKFIYS